MSQCIQRTSQADAIPFISKIDVSLLSEKVNSCEAHFSGHSAVANQVREFQFRLASEEIKLSLAAWATKI